MHEICTRGGVEFGIELLIQFSPPPTPSAIRKMMPPLAALDVADVDVGSHGLGESRAEVGGSRRGGRLNSSGGVGEGGLHRWICGIAELMSKPNWSGISGGFFGGRAPLGPDPIGQFPFFASSQHFDIKVRKLSFFSAGILSLVTCLATRVQLS